MLQGTHPMNVSIKINHIAILIKDLAKARKFYGNILRLEEIQRPEYFIEGIWYKMGDCELHLMLCENFGSPHVHSLDETVQPHFALSMHKEDFQKTVNNLINSGIKFIGAIEEFNGIMQAFFYDDDRNMIEINDALQ
jgi:glyoxylase I family protein